MIMKYAVHADNYMKINQQDKEAVGEIIYPYRGLLDAIKTIANHKDGKRLVFELDGTDVLVNFEREDLIKDLNQILKVNDNTAFIFPFPTDIAKEVPNVIFDLQFAAKTIQEATTLYYMGAREIYVTGSLAANSDDLLYLKDMVDIRMIPNLVQTDAFFFGNPAGVDPLQCFWVRPDGIFRYKSIVKVIEFATDEFHHEPGLLTIYNSGSWQGKLGEVIMDQTGKLDDIYSFYPTSTDREKSECGLKCQKGDSCDVCQFFIGGMTLSGMKNMRTGK